MYMTVLSHIYKHLAKIKTYFGGTGVLFVSRGLITEKTAKPILGIND